jgi:hypothetical protein
VEILHRPVRLSSPDRPGRRTGNTSALKVQDVALLYVMGCTQIKSNQILFVTHTHG